ncbi:hypothetical protein [Actinoplanes sp. NPDC051494]|uniref:hypothetical protein n=1 Tax=Actinoplanes sp. NPDC051494 TaxID=3363907 RepID=UPI0037A35D7E
MTKNMSSRVATTSGKYAGLAVLAGGGVVWGLSDFWWTGIEAHNALVVAAGAAGLLTAGAALVTFAKATWDRVVHPGWWLSIVPVLATGFLTGWVLAPLTAADIESLVWMVLLAGPLVVLGMIWTAGWSSFMTNRDERRRSTPPRSQKRLVPMPA